MSDAKIIKTLKQYRKISTAGKKHRDFFSSFSTKMVYRTTKTEHPETNLRTVKKVLRKMSAKI